MPFQSSSFDPSARCRSAKTEVRQLSAINASRVSHCVSAANAGVHSSAAARSADPPRIRQALLECEAGQPAVARANGASCLVYDFELASVHVPRSPYPDLTLVRQRVLRIGFLDLPRKPMARERGIGHQTGRLRIADDVYGLDIIFRPFRFTCLQLAV